MTRINIIYRDITTVSNPNVSPYSAYNHIEIDVTNLLSATIVSGNNNTYVADLFCPDFSILVCVSNKPGTFKVKLVFKK